MMTAIDLSQLSKFITWLESEELGFIVLLRRFPVGVRAARIRWIFSRAGKIFLKGEEVMVTLKPGEAVDFLLEILDVKGRPAKIDGVPAYTNSNAAAADLQVNPDGLGGKVVHLDGGTAQIKVEVDADLGPGIRAIIGLGDVECLPLEAQTVGLAFGTPVPFTPAP
jgi:hypothetical protein